MRRRSHGLPLPNFTQNQATSPVALRGLLGTLGRSAAMTLQIVGISGLVLFPGCSRVYYREQADRAGVCTISEKNNDPRWKLNDLTIYPDPRSRFHDPYNPDCPPMPPDDPVAHQFMHCLNNMKHWKKWHRNGDIQSVENPTWEVALPEYTQLNDKGEIKLDLRSAVQMARLHNPEYQGNIEEVFLAALDVAFERFRFDVQFFGNSTTSFRVRGNEPPAVIGATGPGGPVNSTSILTQQENFGFTRRFATGADLLVQFANSFVWQFSGPDTNFATSLINFSLVQPLLRNGGRAVVLEQLTRAERALLAAIRSQAQFRQDFYRNTAIGGGITVSPNRIGGFQGGAGLSGFTGTGQGGFGGVGAGQNFGTQAGNRGGVGNSGAGGGAGLAGGGEGTVGGFFGLVQQSQAIKNTQSSLASQQLTLELLEANFEAGLIDLVQVDEFRQNIETERANLLRSQIALQDTIENFLITTIGLPPTLKVAVDDTLVRPFQIIATELSALQNTATELMRELGGLPVKPGKEKIDDLGKRAAELVTKARSEAKIVEDELKELKSSAASLVKGKNKETRLKEIELVIEKNSDSLKQLMSRLDSLEKETKEAHDSYKAGKEKDATDQIVKIVRSTSAGLEELALVQARARIERVNIDEISISPAQAFDIARVHRLDWMNRRASLVDQWRLIEFNANRLRSNLSIQFDGDIGTKEDRPFAFRAPTGSLRARVIFDAPLNRVSERNLYRESLINYQQAKRGYITYVDRIHLTLRSRLRQLERLQTNLEIQRRALAIAIRRVDQTLEDLNRPLQASAPGQAPATLGPTLAQNLLRAIADLRNTQDNFMSVFLNFEAAKITLLFDLGLMELDEQGVLIDRPINEYLGNAMSTCKEVLQSASTTEKVIGQIDTEVMAGAPIPATDEDVPVDDEINRLLVPKLQEAKASNQEMASTDEPLRVQPAQQQPATLVNDQASDITPPPPLTVGIDQNLTRQSVNQDSLASKPGSLSKISPIELPESPVSQSINRDEKLQLSRPKMNLPDSEAQVEVKRASEPIERTRQSLDQSSNATTIRPIDEEPRNAKSPSESPVAATGRAARLGKMIVSTEPSTLVRQPPVEALELPRPKASNDAQVVAVAYQQQPSRRDADASQTSTIEAKSNKADQRPQGPATAESLWPSAKQEPSTAKNTQASPRESVSPRINRDAKLDANTAAHDESALAQSTTNNPSRPATSTAAKTKAVESAPIYDSDSNAEEDTDPGYASMVVGLKHAPKQPAQQKLIMSDDPKSSRSPIAIVGSTRSGSQHHHAARDNVPASKPTAMPDLPPPVGIPVTKQASQIRQESNQSAAKLWPTDREREPMSLAAPVQPSQSAESAEQQSPSPQSNESATKSKGLFGKMTGKQPAKSNEPTVNDFWAAIRYVQTERKANTAEATILSKSPHGREVTQAAIAFCDRLQGPVMQSVSTQKTTVAGNQ